ncbi:hypothetical protein BHAOGJBA_5567 [Methylobacterium hispanicum]|uniref:Multi-ubiquitin domain-containing protein n=1 Tax=Methylobacterium hispanicum TaxID=270350 RepID=A0AAV4ZTW0_9HYPH|nr:MULTISPECIES: multiubiquitin domain-containing protein [Methylobacterium]GJD92014.1 hypothetical protein BHAOGJBA_5567 [Methylobacterium hispanicum]
MKVMDNARARSFVFPVNGAPVRFDDGEVTGREVLTRAGLLPASEHQLILVRGGRTHLVGTDDKVDLVAEEGGAFRGFRSDRSFSFTVDEVGQVWGDGRIEVDELLAILHVPAGHDLVLEREDEPDKILRPGGAVSFETRGVEHIVSRRAQRPDFVLVTVFTTSGVFPAEGAVRVPATTPVADVLVRAARKLELGDTATWITTVGNRDIDPSASFAGNGLSGEVEIEWGPREGGGGARA